MPPRVAGRPFTLSLWKGWVRCRTDERRADATRSTFTLIESRTLANRIAAHKHTTRLHVLRDRVKRALRDQKHGVAGATERVAAHRAARTAYRAAHP